eukprot:2082959-Pyramimonas_sp.AAC.1
MRRWPPSSLEDWLQGSRDFQASREDDRVLVERGLKRAKQDPWDEWQEHAFKKGARAIHRLTKLKPKWSPTIAQGHPGAFSSDPQELLRAEGDTLARFWHASAGPDLVEVPDRVHLPRASAQEIRKASASFSANTSQ